MIVKLERVGMILWVGSDIWFERFTFDSSDSEYFINTDTPFVKYCYSHECTYVFNVAIPNAMLSAYLHSDLIEVTTRYTMPQDWN